MPQPAPAAPTPPANPAPPAGEPPANTPPAAKPGDADKGPAGGKDAILADLAKERDARQALQKQVDALAPLGQLAAMLNVKPEQGKTDVQTLTEQVAAMQKQQADDRLARLRAEVALDKKLPKAIADRLRGSTAEELAADADALMAAFPAAAAGAGAAGTPAPDHSQGARGGARELEAALAEAQKAGKTREAIRLKTLIAQQRTTT